MHSVTDILGPDGPLADRVPGFRPRPQQQSLALAVETAIDSGQPLVAEAGTGVGKTFAYLVPALASRRRVIISTGTKHLQDQLFHRDLPLVREALGVGARVSLLKGRGNYLCLHRLDLTRNEGRFRSRDLVGQLSEVSRWAPRTDTGDLADLASLPEDSPLIPSITSTADNCLGQKCPAWSDCFVVKARRRAQEADIVVVNHHLLLADMVLKEEGFGDLLPGADAVIVDEAHQLPEVAALHFGQSVTGRRISDLAHDSLAEYLETAADMPGFRALCDAVGDGTLKVRAAFGRGSERRPWSEAVADATVRGSLEELLRRLTDLLAALEALKDRSRGLENCHQRCETLVERLELLLDEAAGEGEYVRWVETFRRGFALHMTPVDPADALSADRERHQATWIFTSATLAVGGETAHFANRIGLEGHDSLVVDSPFDYENNALMFTPERMPPPNSPDFTDRVIEEVDPILEASGGRAFLLFTSYRALNRAASYYRDDERFEVFVQGDAPRAQLLDRFRASRKGVLLGTGSFWEGVDVKGEALSVVAIDKLPFAAPSDPVLQARLDACRRNGGNPFGEHQLPQAVITLKQGVGRLIRDYDDTGVLMVCDPRLYTKGYGRTFLKSLPPMRTTRDRAEAERFLADLANRRRYDVEEPA